MNTKDGRQHTTLRVETFTLRVNDDVSLYSSYQFDIDVSFEHWDAVYYHDYEQPDEPQYVDLYSVKIIDRACLSGDKGMTVYMDPRFELLEVLTDNQFLAVCDVLMLRQESVKL